MRPASHILRTQILGHYHLKLADFASTEDAFNAADKYALQHAEEFGYPLTICRSADGDKLFDRFLFIKGLGKVKKWSQKEKQEITRNCEAKSAKCLADQGAALELLGPMDGQMPVKEENPEFATLKPKLDTLGHLRGK